MCSHACEFFTFFFNASPPTEIYNLSLHDALPISPGRRGAQGHHPAERRRRLRVGARRQARSEEHTSELQSLTNLVCRLLLEKKKKTSTYPLIKMHVTGSIGQRSVQTKYLHSCSII